MSAVSEQEASTRSAKGSSTTDALKILGSSFISCFSYNDSANLCRASRVNYYLVTNEVASGIAQECPEYRAMAEAVHSATEMVSMASELEAYGEREEDE